MIKMTMTRRFKLALVCNIAIVILEIIGVSIGVYNSGWKTVAFYTEDSNIISLVASAIYVYFAFKTSKEQVDIPQWVRTFKYISTCCLTVTFVVVMFVLAPGMGVGGYQHMLFSGSFLFNHFLCPILSILSFLFFEGVQCMEMKANLYALIPTAIYAATTVILNVMRVMEGPYPFLYVYKQPVYASVLWCIAILGGDFLFALLLRKMNEVRLKKMTI